MFAIIIYLLLIILQCVYGIFEFPKTDLVITDNNLKHLNDIKVSYLNTAVSLGVSSIEKQEGLENILLLSSIIVKNGTISHAQYLDTFPNIAARFDDKIARKILKSSLYILNSECLPQNIDAISCRNYFSNISLPESDLKNDCLRTNQKHHNGNFAFRRLLPAKYSDGFYKIYQNKNLPSPRVITNLFFKDENDNVQKDISRNLILVQWSQFIEHDLSKSVVTTMKDGLPIECCDSNFYTLTPRYVHPACTPLYGVPPENQYERVTCLNYVRSALTVGEVCNFGAAEQLNQATGILDLSQLYGFSKEAQNMMRTFKNGKLKSSKGENLKKPFLPKTENRNEFCVDNENSTDDCFMAGDSRVNSNPFTIILYTIFLRNHNLIARKLKVTNPQLTDDLLYQKSKKININTYRNIIYNEWLPFVLGKNIANSINSEIVEKVNDPKSFGTSNEFGVAAIRFYYSMMPNALMKASNSYPHPQDNLIDSRKIINEEVFSMSDEFFKSDFLSHPDKLNVALNGMFNQKAMKMDSKYAESFKKRFLKTSLSAQKVSGHDALALDIQRGRDHGLQGYIKYLEICENINVTHWKHLEGFIGNEEIDRLKTIYKTVDDIDLIVGGISEEPKDGSIIGPTFTCILGEQFSNIKRWQNTLEAKDESDNQNYVELWSAAKLLCETTSITYVPINVFLVPSETNPLALCSEI